MAIRDGLLTRLWARVTCYNWRPVSAGGRGHSPKTDENVPRHKQEAYQRLETGSHWPCKEDWFAPDRRNQHHTRRGSAFFDKPPLLTTRQQELHGLRSYETDNKVPREPQPEPEPEPEPEL